MTMMGARLEGTVDKDKILRRFNNLLHLVYLQAESVEGGGYRIPEKTFESIQTELDFHPPEEKDDKALELATKRRYRQRNSYRFWKDSLDLANIPNEEDAKEFLMKIYTKLDTTSHYGSMTHSRYAMETMMLALDDVYGTNKTLLHQHTFIKKKYKKVKKGRKGKKANKVAKAKKSLTPMPF